MKKFILIIKKNIFNLLLLVIVFTILFYFVKYIIEDSKIKNIKKARETNIINDISFLIDSCKKIGCIPFSINGKCFVWEVNGNKDRITKQLDKEQRVDFMKDSIMTVFIVSPEREVLVGYYSVSKQPGYKQFVDIYVINWPDKKAVGMYTIESGNPQSTRTVKYNAEYADPAYAIINWIKSLNSKEMVNSNTTKENKIENSASTELADIERYLTDNKIKVKPTESGLYYIEIKKGNGAKAETGKKVKVNYVGKFISGKVFDTNIESEAKKANVYSDKRPYDAFEFELGKREVIPGWEEGLSMMKVGGKAKFIIPSKLGYGENGAGGVIPPYAPLVFEVQLLGVK